MADTTPESKTQMMRRHHGESSALDKEAKAAIKKATKARDKVAKKALIKDYDAKKKELKERHARELAELENPAAASTGPADDAAAASTGPADDAAAASTGPANDAAAADAAGAPDGAPDAAETPARTESASSMKKRHMHEIRSLISSYDAKIKKAKKNKSKKNALIVEKQQAEAAMEAQHAAELEAAGYAAAADAAADAGPSADDAGSDAVAAGGFKVRQGRKSKAQLRKEKKAAAAAARQAEAQAELEAMGETERQKENEAIFNRLAAEGLMVHQIAADGHCMFSSILHQLGKPGSEVSELRLQVVQYIRNHRDEFSPYMISPLTGEMMSDEQFEAYCVRMAATAEWGSHLELVVMTHLFQRPIHIYNARDTMVMGSDYAADDVTPLRLSYHEHQLSMGEHYNSVVAIIAP